MTSSHATRDAAKPKRKIQPSPVATSIPRRQLRSIVKAIHVAPSEGDTWVVHKAGPRRIRKIFATRDEALNYVEELERGQKEGQKAGLFFHDRDGQVHRGRQAKREMAQTDKAL